MFRKTGQIVFNAEGGGGGAPAPTPGVDPSAHPVAAPWAGAQGMWTFGEGDAAKPWYESIPEPEAREHIKSKAYANPAELALANYNLTKMQRNAGDVVTIPGKDATPEAMKEFHRKIGVPDTPDGYNETLKFDANVQVDPTFLQWGKDTFHKHGLTPAQAKGLADDWNGFIAAHNGSVLDADRAANEADLNALQTRWGTELEQNKAAGRRVVDALGLSTDLIGKIEANMGSAAIVELLAMIGRKSDEGGFFNGNNGGDPNDPSNMTKEQASAKIKELQGDAEFTKRYTDPKHPAHADAVKQMERLFARA